uniref:TENCON variant P54CR4-31 n=1 Tax=synthetic construct TaxID=32630 RepID=UPI0003E5C6DE|nr:Chain A, TENCON variant P54CR4-31 [synthetic construct]4LPT_B Chain B, TENCON variant P54CR4-31 [synthetic construct]4LPT_C Chain C, TENCON variant P54CR4-31 [synthetic construct]4LPT_D Chain D, TENCON variant P54CR4-31 [synthetic construct]4LPT_E Chain E, TENCON variant P54CR4-31 [synthetic construct]4LPT_F Chain F, TENCON variant P54CR4-31 [synthetic construct]
MLPAPKNLVVSEVTEDSLRLSWTAPDAAFDSFLIQYQESEKVGEAINLTVPGSERSYDLTGLKPGTEYTVSIYGVLGSYVFEHDVMLPLSAEFTTGGHHHHHH